MPFSPTLTLAAANALVPFIADEAVRLRAAFSRLREIDAAREQGAAHAGGAQVEPASTGLAEERAALEVVIIDALASLAVAGAQVRLDPPGVDVGALHEGRRVRLHWLEGEAAFTLWRDGDGDLHEIDDPNAFGAAIAH